MGSLSTGLGLTVVAALKLRGLGYHVKRRKKLELAAWLNDSYYNSMQDLLIKIE